MNLPSRKATIVTCLSVVASGLSLWTGFKVLKLTLPFPITVPALNLGVALAGLTILWSTAFATSFIQGRRSTVLLAGVVYVALLLPVVLSVLSATYIVPADLRACRAAIQWDHWFRTKNEAVVRSIQNQLHCCGFNSMRDRASPFPSRDANARTCELTSGYTTHCGPLWQEQAFIAAVLTLTASLLNELILLLILLSSSILLPIASRHTSRQVEDPQRSLLGRVEDDIQSTLAEEQRRSSERDADH